MVTIPSKGSTNFTNVGSQAQMVQQLLVLLTESEYVVSDRTSPQALPIPNALLENYYSSNMYSILYSHLVFPSLY